MPYDSTQERLFHKRNPNLIQFNDFLKDPLNQSQDLLIRDTEGFTQKCKVDFKYGDILIEYKSHELNNIRSKSVSSERIANQLRLGKSEDYAKLKYGFNHSLFKQQLIHEAYPDRLLVVFKDNTKLSTFRKNLMDKAGLHWCYENEMLDKLQSMQTALASNAA